MLMDIAEVVSVGVGAAGAAVSAAFVMLARAILQVATQQGHLAATVERLIAHESQIVTILDRVERAVEVRRRDG